MILKSQVYSEHIIEYIAYITEVSKVYLLLKILWSAGFKGEAGNSCSYRLVQPDFWEARFVLSIFWAVILYFYGIFLRLRLPCSF